MSEGSEPEQGELGILRAGDRLRMAREGAGLTLADIAAKTRITTRHLEALERSDFAALPGRTYVTGFAKAYARAIDLPEAEIGNEIRAELSEIHSGPREVYEAYEPADPARVPSRRVALTVLAAVLILTLLYATWRTLALDSSVESAEGNGAEVASNPEADTATSGEETGARPDPLAVDTKVVLTGFGEVWIGFDDATGKTENWRTLDAGEELVVPADYLDQFTLRTAQPQNLKIMVGDKDVGPIGPASTLVKNVSLKPADLLARVSADNSSPSAPAP